MCTVCSGTPASIISLIHEICESQSRPAHWPVRLWTSRTSHLTGPFTYSCCRSITPRKEGINSLHVNILLWIILRCSWPPLPFCSPAVTGSSDRKIQNKKTSSAAAVISSTLGTSASDSLTHRHPACCFLQSDPAYWASTRSSC